MIRQKHLLILGDERGTQEFDLFYLQKILEGRCTWEIASARTRALRLCQDLSFDLVIIDERLSDNTTGIDMAADIRTAVEGDLPILLATHEYHADFYQQAKKLRILDFLIKPFSPKHTLSAIESAAARSKVMKTLAEKIDHAKVVHTALGVIMERRKLTFDAAEHWLHRTARKESRKIGEIAQEIIESANIINRN